MKTRNRVEGYHTFKEDDCQQYIEARYWNPQNANICIVAVITKGVDWAAYIGANSGFHTEREALEWAQAHGAKLSKEDAQYFFPGIKNLPYRY